MTVPVSGFLSDDGTFFHTEPEARRHTARTALEVYCDSQRFDAVQVIGIIQYLSLTIRDYINADEQCIERQCNWKATEEVAEDQHETDDEADAEEARHEADEARSAGYEDDVARTLASLDPDFQGTDTDGPDDDTGPAGVEPFSDLPTGPAEDFSPAPPGSADDLEGTRSLPAPQQLKARRPVSLSDVGGDPLPTAVPGKGPLNGARGR
jgi:hypothetical protein